MEQSIWTDFISQQTTSVVLLIGMAYFGFRFFKTQQDKKDAIIAAKDQKLEDQSSKVMDLYGKAIEAQNRSTLISEQLLESVNRLNDKIK